MPSDQTTKKQAEDYAYTRRFVERQLDSQRMGPSITLTLSREDVRRILAALAGAEK